MALCLNPPSHENVAMCICQDVGKFQVERGYPMESILKIDGANSEAHLLRTATASQPTGAPNKTPDSPTSPRRQSWGYDKENLPEVRSL